MSQALFALTISSEGQESDDPTGLLPCCGQPPVGLTTLLQAGQPAYLCEGRLFSSCGEEHLTEQQLLVIDEGCQPSLHGGTIAHVHGADCGHERILHGDHFDYLVGNELQHVPAYECCAKKCMPDSKPVLRSHGYVSVLRHRRPDANACKGREGLQQIVTQDDTGSMVTSKLYVNGLCCPSEVPIIQSALGSLQGVIKVDCVVPTRVVFVQHDSALISASMLVAALNGAHLDAALAPPRSSSPAKGHWLPPWNICLSAALLIVSLVHYGARHGPSWLEHFKWAALAAVGISIPNVGRKALFGLRHRVLDINALMVLATVGAVAIEDYTEGAAVLVLFAVASWLEEGCGRRARDAVSAVVAMQPAFATLATSGQEVPAEDLLVGTQILLKPGDRAPADGVVVSGASRMDESLLTGEPAPVSKRTDDKVLGGTANVGSGVLTVTCTALAADSAVAKVSRLVEQTMGQQSRSEGAVLRFAKYYTPVVVLACILIIVVPAALQQPNLKDKVYLALQVLVTACPCALVLSTPVVVVAGLTAAAKNGVLIKGGHVLESLAAVKAVNFDKTGTLTQGRFQVEEVVTDQGVTEARMLQLSACLEKTSSHPLAAVIVGRAAAMHLPLDAEVTNSQTLPGLGLTGLVGGHSVAVGNSLLMAQQCADSACVEEQQAERTEQGTSVCWVALDGKVAGFLALADSVRPEAASAVHALQQAGVVTAMLTGDNQAAAADIAAGVGMTQEHVHANLLPEDKYELVARYRKECGAVMHIGDGINDAPALAAADVGVAMGVAGAAVAIDAADMALFTNDLRCLSHIILFGRKSKRKILLNIGLSVVTKVVVLVLAALGMFTLWGAVLVDVGTALLVILHGMMLLRWRLPQAMVADGAQNVQCSQQRWSLPPSIITAGSSDAASAPEPCCDADTSCDVLVDKCEGGELQSAPAGRPSCCSAASQCKCKAAALKPEAPNAGTITSDARLRCDTAGDQCKAAASAPDSLGIKATRAPEGPQSCCSSGTTCEGKAGDGKPAIAATRRQGLSDEHRIDSKGCDQLPNCCASVAPPSRQVCCKTSHKCQDSAASSKVVEGTCIGTLASKGTCCSSGKQCTDTDTDASTSRESSATDGPADCCTVDTVCQSKAAEGCRPAADLPEDGSSCSPGNQCNAKAEMHKPADIPAGNPSCCKSSRKCTTIGDKACSAADYSPTSDAMSAAS